MASTARAHGRARLPAAAGLPDIETNATLTTRVRDALEAAIIGGALKPGERIHTDDLAARYGMSRIPVREALQSLHAAGWVEIRPRYGVRVRERTAKELGELFEFRAVVESQVARWAAQRRTDEELQALQDIVKASTTATDDEELLASASDFYAALRSAAHNTVLEQTSATLEKRARFYFSTLMHDFGRDWVKTHQELLALVRERQGQGAAKLAQQHIEDTGRAVEKLLFPK